MPHTHTHTQDFFLEPDKSETDKERVSQRRDDFIAQSQNFKMVQIERAAHQAAAVQEERAENTDNDINRGIVTLVFSF